MTLQQLEQFHQQFQNSDATFYTEVIHDDIWGDLGVDSATVSIQAKDALWHLHYIRTQSGIPCILAEYTSEVIDEYTKELSHEQLYDFLTLHAITDIFEDFALTKTK